MAYTEVFYPKLPMEGCADRIQDVIVRSGFSNGQVSERYRLETPGGSVLVLVLVKYLHRTGSEMVVTAVPDACEDAEDDAALDGHAALPDVEEFCQMMAVVIPVEEKNIP